MSQGNSARPPRTASTSRMGTKRENKNPINLGSTKQTRLDMSNCLGNSDDMDSVLTENQTRHFVARHHRPTSECWTDSGDYVSG